MLGSVADAEDALQDAFIRWQRASETDVRSPKAFLVTIVSRLCINHLQSARVQRETYVGEWLPEPIVTEPGSDVSRIAQVDESVSMAFARYRGRRVGAATIVRGSTCVTGAVLR
jgi:RNA polymerase sigma-70 factor (ECF subfamily)